MNRRRFIEKTGFGIAGVAVTSNRVLSAEVSAHSPMSSDRPNVLLIMADDMGFSDAGCYGGEIKTPNLDMLAENGVRFTQHYSCGRCWPSRACTLTGYYPQQVRRDNLAGIKMGNRPKWAPLIPERINPLGYKSYHSGKWHIDGNPLNNGFGRSWGSERNGCDWDRYFASGIWQEDDLKAPVNKGEQYYSTVAIADHAIACLKLHEKNHPQSPFFQYVAFYSPHFPLQAMQKDIDKYRKTYQCGWDKVRAERLKRLKTMNMLDCGLSKREEKVMPSWNLKEEQLKNLIGPGEVGHALAWDSLTEEQKEFQSTKMAIHAAMISRMDAEIGRIIKQLKDMGEFDNTLIMFQSDNGASAEQIIRGDRHDKSAPLGSAKSYVCLGPGWSTAANTPFRFHKHWNHEGGISSPFIVHWPKMIKTKGELRRVPTHFIDIAPTVVALAGGEWKRKWKGKSGPMTPGKDLLATFVSGQKVDREALWWAHKGNRAIRMGDWKLSMRKRGGGWELYNMNEDRSEMHDLVKQYPERVKKLAEKWEEMANGFRKGLK